MAIDTRQKRASVANHLNLITPIADGTVGVADREHVAGFYMGISPQSLLRLIKVFMFRDGGTPKTGLSPIVDIFVKAIDGTSAGSVPTVIELSGGYYKFHHNVAQDTVVRVDSGDALMATGERYLDIGVVTQYDDAIDIKLSDLEDNIRGTDNDDLTMISSEISNIGKKVDRNFVVKI